MKDIISLGKTITFFNVSLTTALHQELLSVPLDMNQEISEQYLFVQKILLWYGVKGDKLKPWLARKCTKLS